MWETVLVYMHMHDDIAVSVITPAAPRRRPRAASGWRECGSQLLVAGERHSRPLVCGWRSVSSRASSVSSGTSCSGRTEPTARCSCARYRGPRPRSEERGVCRYSVTVCHYEGEEGAERLVRNETMATRARLHYTGEKGAERLVCCELPCGVVGHYEGEKGAERLVRIHSEQLSGL